MWEAGGGGWKQKSVWEAGGGGGAGGKQRSVWEAGGGGAGGEQRIQTPAALQYTSSSFSLKTQCSVRNKCVH